MSSSEVLSPSIEEYLQAICRLSQMPDGVSTTRLARRLSVKPASVTGMLRKLSEKGLITYRRYRNITLTRAGDRRANDLVRRHRLTERLLTDVLGVPLEEAHDEACPHGNPLDVGAEDNTVRLVDAPENLPLAVVRLEDESSEVVRYLAERNLLPGSRVKMKLREPLGGGVVLEVAGKTQILGADVAASIRVRQVRRRR